MKDWHWSIGIAVLFIQVGGVLLALRAILISRTPQAGIAWVIGLITFPILAIPLFLVFGESRFTGYKQAGRGESPELDRLLDETDQRLRAFQTPPDDPQSDAIRLNERLIGLPLTHGNRADLLVDGKQTFDAIGSAIDAASESVVFQFFIIRDDGLGKKMQTHLIAALRRGVEVFVTFDQVGSHQLPESYIEDLKAAGAQVRRFVTNRQLGTKFRVNFRNHRKLVLVDRKVAFVGGLNVGDEYMGLSPRFGPWRDTFVRLEGPVAHALAIPFAEDWEFTSKSVPALRGSDIPIRAGEARVFTIPAGPAPVWNVCPATLIEIIRSTRRRLWLASPYFIPDSSLLAAIGHAALRGVDVRLILPQNPDHLLPWLTSFTFYPKLREAGVRVFRYQTGFMHQKVLLADDSLAVVGSINLDYRSFMLNFELSVGVFDQQFAHSVEQMFLEDFAESNPEDLRSYEDGSLVFRLKCRAASLLSTQQ
ncbi:MAG: cardiolipin synthase [Chthoniobacterales bacterium]